MKSGFKYDGYLKHIADDKLLSEIKRLVNEERDIQIEVIHHLAEINARRLHEARGYSSLHEYAVRGLGYSDGAAQRRIKTMRLCADLPEVEELIRPGKLNLTSASQLQSMFERQQRSAQREAAPEQVWNDEKKLDLVRKVEGKSTRETERLIADAAPEVAAPQERSRYLGNGKWELRIVVTETVWSELESLKDLLSHRIPSRSNSELLALLAHDGSTKYDPRRRGRGRRVAQASAPRAAAQGSPRAGAGDHLVAPAPLPDTGPATPAPENTGGRLMAAAPQPARRVAPPAPAAAPADAAQSATPAPEYAGACLMAAAPQSARRIAPPAPAAAAAAAAQSATPAPEYAGACLMAAAPQSARRIAPPAPAAAPADAAQSATPAPEYAGGRLTAAAPQPARSVAPASAPAQRGRRAAQASAPRGAAQGSPRAGAGDQLVAPAPFPDTGSATPAPEYAGACLMAAAPQSARRIAPPAPAAAAAAAAQSATPAPEYAGACLMAAAPQSARRIAPPAPAAAPADAAQSATPAPEYAGGRLTAAAPQPARSVAPASAPAQRGRRAAQASAPRGAAQGSPRAGAGDQLVAPAPFPDTGSATPAPEYAGACLMAAAPQSARRIAPPAPAAAAAAAADAAQSATPAPEYAAARRRTTTRQVPAAIRRAVWVRDQGRCQFVDAATGTRCGSRYQLQLDHLQPWACGGDHDETNLQLACSRHNRYRARRTFGARTRARGACSAAERRSGL